MDRREAPGAETANGADERAKEHRPGQSGDGDLEVLSAFGNFYNANSPERGSLDICCIGPGHPERAAIASALLLLVSTVRDTREPAYRHVQIALPPSASPEVLLTELERFWEFAKSRNYPLSLDDVRGRVITKKMPSASSRELAEWVNNSCQGSAVLVIGGSTFRSVAREAPAAISAGTRSPFGETIQNLEYEDHWVWHTARLAGMLRSLAANHGLYVQILASELTPSARSNLKLLYDACDAALGVGRDEPSPGPTNDDLRRWGDQLREGRTEPVFAEIDESVASESGRAALKAQLLLSAGRAGEAYQIGHDLEAVALDGTAPTLLPMLARIALHTGRVAECRSWLTSAVQLDWLDEVTLQSLRRLAAHVGAESVTKEVTERLLSCFPDCSYSLFLRSEALLNSDDPAGVVALLEPHHASDGLPDVLVYELELARALADPTQPLDYVGIVDRLALELPDYAHHAAMDCAAHAITRDDADAAITVLERAAPPRPDATGLARTAAKLARVVASQANSPTEPSRASPERIAESMNLLARSVLVAAKCLGGDPGDGPARLSLANALSIEVAGDLGIETLLELATAGASDAPAVSATGRGSAAPAPSADFTQFALRYVQLRFARTPYYMIVGEALPPELLDEPHDRLLASATELLQHIGEQLVPGETDKQDLLAILKMTLDLARHIDDRTTAAEAIRVGAQALANAGQFQDARDIAEHTLQLSRTGRPAEKRMAWATFADIYHRCRNLSEALLGWVCASQVPHAELSADEWYFELTVLMRILRDLGHCEAALKLAGAARKAASASRAPSRAEEQLSHVEGSVILSELHARVDGKNRASQEHGELLVDILTNRLAEDVRYGSLPAVSLLAETARYFQSSGTELPPAITELISAAISGWGDATRKIFDGLAKTAPDTSELAELLGALKRTRHSEDAATDAHTLRVFATRQLHAAVQDKDPARALFCIDCLSDHSIWQPGESPDPTHEAVQEVLAWSVGRAADHEVSDALKHSASTLAGSGKAAPLREHFLQSPDEVATTVARLRSENLEVVGLALNSAQQLVRVSLGAQTKGEVALLPRNLFDREAFDRWGLTLPYAYSRVSGPNSVSEFERSMAGLQIGELPSAGTIVFVREPYLQAIPHNLWPHGSLFCGTVRACSSVPSLAWLSASRQMPPEPGGTSLLWLLPSGVPSSGPPTAAFSALDALEGKLSGAVTKHRMKLVRSPELPAGLGPIEVAVVGAHGRLGVMGRFFTAAAGEEDTRYTATALGGQLSEAKLVVLLVCSGGRMDRDTLGARSFGLPYRLLHRGCRAVVASPWPLDALAAARWTRHFLDAWYQGRVAADAVLLANQALEKPRYEPSEYTAMHLYGDPLLARSPASPGGSPSV